MIYAFLSLSNKASARDIRRGNIELKKNIKAQSHCSDNHNLSDNYN